MRKREKERESVRERGREGRGSFEIRERIVRNLSEKMLLESSYGKKACYVL